MKYEAMLKASRGTLIVVSSISAFHANSTLPAYAAAKAGAVWLVTVLVSAWARDGERVNSIAPGLVLTKAARSSRDPAMAAQAREMIPMGRIGTPQDMAGVALFLASPLAGYVTGQTPVVDGGLGMI
jgi:3-oxoacyl-[acyl-carrier protein] reductase